MATDQTIADILEEISDAYHTFELTEGRVKVWKKYLKNYDDALLHAALENYISTSGKAFPPSIPEIRSSCTEVRMQIAGIPLALEAWEDVIHAYPPHKVWYDAPYPETGIVGPVTEERVYRWMHPLVEKVAVMLGWPDKFPTSNEIGVDRAHFIRAYESAVNAAADLDRQLPEVRAYVTAQRDAVLALSANVEEGLGKLTKKLEVKHGKRK